MYLEIYHHLKIHLNVEGEIVKVEKEKNGFWLVDCNLNEVFEKLLPQHKQEKIVITLNNKKHEKYN
ncbi:MAG: hypothetical protein JXQ93_09885 [Flavobacteriaceae bacterium]